MADVTVELGNAYIGSAYSPVVEITETAEGHTVSITSADPEAQGQLVTQSYTVPDWSDEEAEREAQEAARQAAESAREAAEQARSIGEAMRRADEGYRQEQEQSRAAAEQARAEAEQARQSAESARASAEGSRVSAEQGRASAEAARASAEAGRASAEQARATAETARAQAEQARQSAEEAREAAEQARQADTAAAIARADAATANANAATTAAQAAAGEADAATDAAEAAAALATAAAETVTDAYFPGLAAGSADGVTGGGPTDSAAWLKRTCPGTDGPATVGSIHGRTLVWNQTAPVPGGRTSSGVTFAKDASAGTLTASGTATADAYASATFSAIAGHKYLMRGCPAGGSDTTYYDYLTGSGLHNYVETGSGIIDSPTADGNASYVVMIKSGTTAIDLVFKPQLFDLTRMFGAGSEPTTVAEFEALYPESYYPYDAGSLLSVQMQGVESTDTDGSELMLRTIPAAVYFPDGMRSAGSAYDELTATQAVTRIGAVDLGTLTWTADTDATGQYFRASLRVAKNTASTEAIANVLCARYAATSMNNVYDGGVAISTSASTTYVYIRDTAYSTKEAFKAAMDGVMLFFELKTPTVTPIDPPLNLTYRAAAGGTERIVHESPSAPPTMDVTYGQTASGIVASALAAIADPDGPTATANHAAGTYLTMGGRLYKVTTAIATGEAIVPGTNVTATTVMAEVLSLTQ